VDERTTILVAPGGSLTVREAIDQGLLLLDPLAIVAEGVRIIPYEDDGYSAGPVKVGAGSRVREGSILCSGVMIGTGTMVGHNCVLRRAARIGDGCVVSHLVCIERETVIGNRVRVSALTHLTGGCAIEDNVEIGARVVTVNDNTLQWGNAPPLRPPVLRRGCRIGSGVTLLAGVEVGSFTLVGAGAVVTRSLPPRVVAYGVPAYVQREALPHELAGWGFDNVSSKP
jgi:acetyltransferase-like isoleucine patch superfamily enzyme